MKFIKCVVFAIVVLLPCLLLAQQQGKMTIEGKIAKGNTVNVTYQPANGPLKGEDVYVLFSDINFSKQKSQYQNLKLNHRDSVWTTTVTIPDTADAIGMLFNNNNEVYDLRAMYKLNSAARIAPRKESDFEVFINWFSSYGSAADVNALKKQRNQKFKNGKWHMDQLYGRFLSASTADSMIYLFKAFRKQFPKYYLVENYNRDIMYSGIAEKMAQEKRWNRYQAYSGYLSEKAAIALERQLASRMLYKGEDLKRAEVLAFDALKRTRRPALNDTTGVQGFRKYVIQDSITKYAETLLLYAGLAYKNQHYQNGLPFAKEAAIDVLKEQNNKAYELYLKLLAKSGASSAAMAAIEQHYKAGKVTDDELEPALKEVYLKESNDPAGFPPYYAALTVSMMNQVKKQLQKDRISIKAPGFILPGLDGRMVNLDSLKGKTVVLDFWATWCVYCKLSFPAMQETMNNFQNNNNVVFLFIDTREGLKDEAKLREEISGYLTANQFRFNVLLDQKLKGPNDNEVVSAFKVSGLPTKIIIDPDGNISFFEVGYNGGHNELVRRLSAMIELTQENK